MKKIKIIMFICFMILLTGCSVESNVVMNEYGKVKENVIISEELSNLSTNEKRAETILKSTLNKYKVALDSREYSYDTKIENDKGVVKFTNNYNNIMDYFEGTVFSQYVYRQMKWTETDEYYEISNVSEHITYCEDCSDWPALPVIRVNITLPVSAAEQDADEVNGTTYTWIFNKDTPASKTFYLKINKNNLKERKNVVKKKKRQKKALSLISKILLVLMFLGILMLIIKYLIKKYKENKIEY